MSDAKCRARPPGQEKATVSRGPDTLRAFSTGARPREVGSTASRLRSPTAPGSLTGWARRPGSPTARRSHGPAHRAAGSGPKPSPRPSPPKAQEGCQESPLPVKPQTRAGARVCWLLKHFLEQLGLCFIAKITLTAPKEKEQRHPHTSQRRFRRRWPVRTRLGGRGRVLTNGPAEVLHQHFRLLDLRGVYFTPHHRAEGDLTPQLLSNSQS